MTKSHVSLTAQTNLNHRSNMTTSQDMNIDLLLDVHFNAIRQKFDRLNQELDEARNQRDDYMRNCIVCFGHKLLVDLNPVALDENQAKELQELRRKIFAASEDHIVCQHCKSCQTTNDSISPILSPNESRFSVDEEGGRGDNLQENETRKDPTIPGNLSLRSDITYFPQPRADDSGVIYNVEFNHDTTVALKLNLAHALTQNASRTYAAFSPDSKYLATVSEAGIVHIFDAKTGSRLR